jgi:hypothetical protein
MRHKVKYVLIAVAFICFSFGMYSHSLQDGPPPPKAKAADARKGPCGKGNGGGNGPNIPPPVGLCLPINDYLLPLFVAGIFFGAYKIRTFESSK